MLVDLKVTAKTKIKAGDLLVANEHGEFELVNKEDMLRDVTDTVKRQEQEIAHLKDFLKTYQNNEIRLLKEVIRNGKMD